VHGAQDTGGDRHGSDDFGRDGRRAGPRQSADHGKLSTRADEAASQSRARCRRGQANANGAGSARRAHGGGAHGRSAHSRTAKTRCTGARNTTRNAGTGTGGTRGHRTGRPGATGRRATGRDPARQNRSASARPDAGCDPSLVPQCGAQHGRLQLADQRDRGDQDARGMLAAHLGFKRCTAGATLDVGPCPAAGQDLAPQGGDQLPDLGARAVPGLPASDKALAGLEDERLDLRRANPQHGRDLVMRVVPELKQDERRALIDRQALHVLDDFAQLLAPLDPFLWTIRAQVFGDELIEHHRSASRAEHGQTPVPRDREQPWPQRDAVLA
jgi:hypothetical protein